MDDLASLPVDENTSESKAKNEPTLSKVFGNDTPPQKSKFNYKMILITAIFFALFANPYADTLLVKIPYVGSNHASLLAFKTALFTVCFTVLLYYS